MAERPDSDDQNITGDMTQKDNGQIENSSNQQTPQDFKLTPEQFYHKLARRLDIHELLRRLSNVQNK